MRAQQFRTWHGFRLLAIDGSTNQLPNTDEIIAHFGVWPPNNEAARALARVSQLFDVLNDVTLDAIIAPNAQHERQLAALHFEKIIADDLVLLDRGYPAFWVFALILSQNAHFCARMPIGVWNVVDQFVQTGLAEQIVEISPCHKALKECQERKLSTKPIKVRLVRVELDIWAASRKTTPLANSRRL